MYRLSWNLEASASRKPQGLSRGYFYLLPMIVRLKWMNSFIFFSFSQVFLFIFVGHVRMDVSVKLLEYWTKGQQVSSKIRYLPTRPQDVHLRTQQPELHRLALDESCPVSSRKITVSLQSTSYWLRSHSNHLCSKKRGFWVSLKLTPWSIQAVEEAFKH